MRKKNNFDSWHISPLGLRPHAMWIVEKVNSLENINCAYEIGCGLGEIITKTDVHELKGYDLSREVIKAAKKIRKTKVDFCIGSFDDIFKQHIDCLVTVNFMHTISENECAKSFDNIISNNDIEYIVVDEVNCEGYEFHHDFDTIWGV